LYCGHANPVSTLAAAGKRLMSGLLRKHQGKRGFARAVPGKYG
jgi:hypothetical protein